MCSNVVALMNMLLSNNPSGPSEGVPLVTVCAAESSFDHTTVSPMFIDTINGM